MHSPNGFCHLPRGHSGPHRCEGILACKMAFTTEQSYDEQRFAEQEVLLQYLRRNMQQYLRDRDEVTDKTTVHCGICNESIGINDYNHKDHKNQIGLVFQLFVYILQLFK